MKQMGNPIAYLFGKEGLRAVAEEEQRALAADAEPDDDGDLDEQGGAPAEEEAEPVPSPQGESSSSPQGEPASSQGEPSAEAKAVAELVHIFTVSAHNMAKAAALLSGKAPRSFENHEYVCDVMMQAEKFIPEQLVRYVRGTLVLLLTGDKDLANAAVAGDMKALVSGAIKGLMALVEKHVPDAQGGDFEEVPEVQA
jgi:hypothetical protein